MLRGCRMTTFGRRRLLARAPASTACRVRGKQPQREQETHHFCSHGVFHLYLHAAKLADMRSALVLALLPVAHAGLALNRFRATARSRTGLHMSGKPRRVLAELPFAQARAMARSMGMSSREEWDEYSCPGAYRLPNDPDVVWAADWQGWDDWLAQHVDSTGPVVPQLGRGSSWLGAARRTREAS
jgi:hypothetical protein